MKEFKEIIVSKGESVYETIKKLKKEGELEEAWLFVSHEADKRMRYEDEMCVGTSRYVSKKFNIAIELCNIIGSVSRRLPINICDNPKKIFCLDVES